MISIVLPTHNGEAFLREAIESCLALSRDGTRLVTSCMDDTVSLWDTGTGRKIFRLPGHGRHERKEQIPSWRDRTN